MNLRGLIWLSMALNVALAAAMVLSPKRTAAFHTNAPALPIMAGPNNPADPAATTPAPAGLPFSWNQIASENLKIYRDHLRAIGCPEPTLREIIRAVINERFGARRRGILASFQDRYWDLVLHRELPGRQRFSRTEWGQALAALAGERQDLIVDVLGRVGLTTELERQTQRAELEQRRAWLSPEKRDRLIELEARYQQRLADWAGTLGSRVDVLPTPEDQDQLLKWQQEFDDSEKQLLTPEELAELQLRESDVAGWAGSLPGFQPGEDEWRSLTGLRSQYEQSQRELDNSNLSDEERAARQNGLQTGFDDAVKAALTPEQFSQYQLANNDQYQALHNVTQRYGLPDSVATQSLGLQQAARNAADQVRNNSNLSAETRQSALDAIQRETEQALSQLLGPDAFTTFQEYGGDWVTGLNQTN